MSPDTCTLVSRIARSLTQVLDDRPFGWAELAAHSMSGTAVILTILMVGAGQVRESNPVAAFLITHVGLDTWAVLTPVGVALIFAGLRWYHRSGAPTGSRWMARAVVVTFVFDALGNLAVFAVRGPPETFGVAAFAGLSVAVLTVSAVLLARPDPRPLRSHIAAPHRE